MKTTKTSPPMGVTGKTAVRTASSVSEETFDEFLAEQWMLESTEDHAVKELIAEQLAAE